MHFIRSRAEEKSTETRVDKPTEIEYSRVLKSLFQQVFTKQTYFSIHTLQKLLFFNVIGRPSGSVAQW